MRGEKGQVVCALFCVCGLVHRYEMDFFLCMVHRKGVVSWAACEAEHPSNLIGFVTSRMMSPAESEVSRGSPPRISLCCNTCVSHWGPTKVHLRDSLHYYHLHDGLTQAIWVVEDLGGRFGPYAFSCSRIRIALAGIFVLWVPMVPMVYAALRLTETSNLVRM